MKKLGMAAFASLLMTMTAMGGQHTSRTYFGWPDAGPYTKAPKYVNPWTGKILGVRFCKTPEDKYQKFLQNYQIIEARHQAQLKHLNWDNYMNYMNPSDNPGYVGRCNCNFGGGGDKNGCGGKHGCGKSLFGKHHGGDCGSGDCGSGDCGSGNCGSESGDCQTCGWGGKHSGIKALFGKHKGGHGWDNGNNGNGYGNGNAYPEAFPAYPPMNREDAVRYLEGFQYYPPTQIIRSPRDFHMFDVKYGHGR